MPSKTIKVILSASLLCLLACHKQPPPKNLPKDNPPPVRLNDSRPQALAFASDTVLHRAGQPLQLAPLGGESGIEDCSSYPPLPEGLRLSPRCHIQGTPLWPSLDTYTITAHHSHKESKATLILAIQKKDDLALGPLHSCVILPSKQVACWGNNGANYHDAGFEESNDLVITKPRIVNDLKDIIALSAGKIYDQHYGALPETCALSQENVLACWGRMKFQLIPYQSIVGVGNGDVLCLALSDGHLECGRNAEPISHLRIIPSLPGTVGVSCGSYYCYALQKDGRIFYWHTQTPHQRHLFPLPPAALISSGNLRTCALTKDRHAYCWGTENIEPKLITGIQNIQDLSVGHDHVCALHENQISCWGDNEYNQAGESKTIETNLTAPHLIRLPEGFPNSPIRSIAAGGFHSCFRLENNSVWCFGLNEFGQLGNDARDQNSPLPVQVRMLEGL